MNVIKMVTGLEKDLCTRSRFVYLVLQAVHDCVSNPYIVEVVIGAESGTARWLTNTWLFTAVTGLEARTYAPYAKSLER